jgi:tRNA(fMet)-specific endonuclease VapC
MVVLDTDHVSEMERPESKAARMLSARLAQIDPNEIATTVVTYEEQTRGWLAYKARARNVLQEIDAYAKLKTHLETYRTITVLDFDAQAAAELQRLRRLKIRIGMMDLKISSIVLVNDATLLTRNLVDFRKVPGLKAEDWTT